MQKQNFGHLSGRHFLKDLDSCDAIWLERQFTEDEVVQASCGDKALGLVVLRLLSSITVGWWLEWRY